MDPKILQYLREGNTDDALEVLQHNPTKIGCMTVKGNSIFHIAASHGIIKAFSSPFIDLLNDKNGRGLVLHQNETGDTILHCAARTGNSPILVPLIQYYGGNLEDLKNKDGDTVLHVASRGGHAGAVNILLDTRREMAVVVNRDGESPLYLAAERGAVEAVEKLLGCSTVEVGGPRGQTALHAAVCRSHDIAKMLLRKKPELNQLVDASQSAPIHYAASHEDVKMVRLLLQYDASVAHLLDDKGLSAMHIAASQNNANMIEEIFRHCPDATELTDTGGKNFLHVAAKKKAVAVVKLVLNQSLIMQSINEADNEGNTPLHLAVKTRSLEVVRLLLSDSRIKANVKNREGLTPLDIASSCADSGISVRMNKISEELISAGSKFGPRRMDLMMGRDQRKSSEELNRYRTLANNLAIVAVLIATVTFAAAFTLPGGYTGDDNKLEEGTAILANKVAFKVFLISDAIAMISSICVTYLLIYTGSLDHDIRLHSLITSMNLMWVALGGMVVAFSTGIYVVLASKCRWLAVLICVMNACVPFITWIIVCWPTFGFIKRVQTIICQKGIGRKTSIEKVILERSDCSVTNFRTPNSSEPYN